jgi:hypothetical protein
MGIEVAVAAAIASTAIAAAGTAYSVVASEQGKKSQEEAMRKQEQAQREAAGQAQAQQRRSQQAMNAANRREPDMAGIMDRASQGAGGGPSSTMLTGPGGVDPTQLSLGRNTLLGG